MIILNNPLKELDQIYASEEIKKQTLNYVINCKHYSNLLLLVPLCVCVLLFGIFIFPKDGKIVPVAYVSLDINPSLELQLDAKDIDRIRHRRNDARCDRYHDHAQWK